MSSLPQRKQPRLPDYDYSQNGAYFVTICTEGRKHLFGRVCRGDPCGRPYVRLTPLGQIAHDGISYLESLEGISVPIFVVMPDHIHMVVSIERATARVAPTSGQIIGGYKSQVYHSCLDFYKKHGKRLGKIWQRGYYEHVIRNQEDYLACLEYVDGNPAKWLDF